MARWDVFLAHASPDEAVASELDRLLGRDLQVYFRPRMARGGEVWSVELPKAQKDSRVTVALLTEHHTSHYFDDEIRTAIALSRRPENGHRLLPCLLRGSMDDLPYGVHNIHVVDLVGLPLEEAAARIVQEVRGGAPGRPPAEGASRGEGVAAGSEHPALPPGFATGAGIFNQVRVQLPLGGPVKYRAAVRQEALHPRPQVDEVIRDLLDNGSALVVGGPATGKTVLALQVVQRLLADDVPERLRGCEVYYTGAADCLPGQDLLARPDGHPRLLVIDDAHENEEDACEIHAAWLASGEARSRTFLLFTSQPYHTEEDEFRPSNIFHLHTHVVRVHPSDQEFAEFLRRMWRQSDAPSPLPDEQIPYLRALTRRSLALAVLAVGPARRILEHKSFNLQALRHDLVTAVFRHYDLDPGDPDAVRALLLSYYNVPIHIDTFGKEAAERLIQARFLRPAPLRRGYALLALRALADTWHRARPDREMVLRSLARYIQGERSNYHQLLAGIRHAGQLGLLRELVNDYLFAALTERLAAETDLARIAIALEAIANARFRLGRLLLDSVLARRPLLERLQDRADPHGLVRFLNVATYLNRRLFAGQSSSADLVFRLLRESFIGGTRDLAGIARLCGTIARASRDLARRLAAETIKESEFASYAGRTDPGVAHALLTFAGRIAWFDRREALSLAEPLTTSLLTKLVLETTSPRDALRHIKSIDSLNHRRVLEVLKNVLGRDTDAWVRGLTAPPSNLYDIAQLLEEVTRLGRRLGEKLALRLLPGLEAALARDTRLAALGHLLAVLRHANYQVVQAFLQSPPVQERLTSELAVESSPIRLALTLQSVARIDRRRAAEFVASLDDNRLADVLDSSRNLTEVATLIKGLSHAAADPDGLLERLWKSQLTLERLFEQPVEGVDLANFANVIATACPLSWETKRQLLGRIRPERFQQAVLEEDEPRRAGRALRAFAIAFPAEAESFAAALAREDAKIPNDWLRSDDVSAIAFLLHSSSEIDGRLAERLGSEVNRKNRIGDLLRKESKVSRTAEYLYAIAALATPNVRGSVRSAFEASDPLEIMEDCGTLREFVLLFGGIRAAHPRFFGWWVHKVFDKRYEHFKSELLLRCSEESNLGILATLLSLLPGTSSGQQLGRELVASLDRDKEWLSHVAFWDNELIQGLQFITRAARVAADRRWNDFFRTLLRSRLLARLGDLRSVRAVTMALVELFRCADALAWPELRQEGVHNVDLDAIERALHRPDDSAACALLAFLLDEVSPDGFALNLSTTAQSGALRGISLHRSLGPLITIGLLGGSLRTLDDLGLPQGRALSELDCWETGFVNWLHAQRVGRRSGKARPPGPLIVAADLLAGAALEDKVLEEADRLGSNLRFAFLLATARQAGLAPPVWGQLADRALDRERWEARRWVRDLLGEFRESPPGAQAKRRPVDVIGNCVRELAPRVESLGLGDEGRVLEDSHALAFA
jgi:hypothetical protein